MPDTESNVIVTVHSYEPFLFTHQGAEWTSRDCATVGVQYPGPPLTPLKPATMATNSWVTEWINAYNTLAAEVNPSGPMAFKARFVQAQQWAEYFGRPVYLGEFGAYSKAPPESRVNFYRDVRATLDACGIGWAIWDWKGGFAYAQTGLPSPPEMRPALFPPYQLACTVAGAFEFDAAIGKTFIVQKTLSLTAPVSWSSIATQTLVTPKFSYRDRGANDPVAFYRVVWQKQ